MQTDVPDKVPGVDDQQLAAVVSHFPELPNLRAELADRFAQAVRALVEKRAQQKWPNEGEDEEDVAVFVMVDHPRQVGERLGASPFTDLTAKGEPLLGRLFFANRDASAGRFMSMPVSSNEILEWLEDKNLGDNPIVTVYRNSKEMFTRRAGTKDSARSDSIRDQKPSATLMELRQALQYFHLRQLLTPTCCPDGVWEPGRAREYIPGPEPEKCIQRALAVALDFWFHGVVKAECEDRTSIGRIDIRLLKKSNDQGRLSYWVIMELKVIKSFTNPSKGSEPSTISTSVNIRAIVNGVRQAGAYRANRGAEEGLLEIYDLRKDKTDNLTGQSEVSTAMNKFTPRPQIDVWSVFGSSEDARKAGYTGV